MIFGSYSQPVPAPPSASDEAHGGRVAAGGRRATSRAVSRAQLKSIAVLLSALLPALILTGSLAAREKEPPRQARPHAARSPAAKSDANKAEATKPTAAKTEATPSDAAPSATEPPATAPTQATTPPAPPARPELAARAAATPSDHEGVEADVSTRSVAVTSAFRGSEVVVFGTVLNSRQESAESGLYDVVLVVEGSPTQAVVRRKSDVGGIWLNTSSLKYDRVPSYFAIVSTRPLDEIADEQVLAQNGVGFKYIRLEGALGASATMPASVRDSFRDAVIRLKQKEGLFFTEDYGVAFIGKALFRSTVTLPAAVKVGPVAVHVLLFRDGELLSRMTSRVVLTRQGLEHFIYAAAFTYPLLYGLVAVAIAVAAGLLASLLVRR